MYIFWRDGEIFIPANEQDEYEIKRDIRKKMNSSHKNFKIEFSDLTNDYATGLLEKDIKSSNLALIGDSHAGHLVSGLYSKKSEKYNIIDFHCSSIVPYMNIYSESKKIYNINDTRYELMNKGYNVILENKNIKTVIISHRPHNEYKNIFDDNDRLNKDIYKIIEKNVIYTLDALRKHSKNVIIILDNPRLPFHPSTCVRKILKNKNEDCKFDKKFFYDDKGLEWYSNLVRKTAKNYDNVSLVDFSKLFCDEKYCHAKKNGKVLYSDGNHLSIDGSMYVAPVLMEAIIQAEKRNTISQ